MADLLGQQFYNISATTSLNSKIKEIKIAKESKPLTFKFDPTNPLHLPFFLNESNGAINKRKDSSHGPDFMH